MAVERSSRSRACVRVCIGVLALALGAGAARAEESAADSSAATPAGFSYSVEVTTSFHHVSSAFFGARRDESDPQSMHFSWGEGFTRARANYHLASGVWGSVGGVVMGTAGADYLKAKDVGDGRLDQLVVGVSALGASGVSLALGRQDLQVGDGFVIGDGYRDTRAALWNIPLGFYDAARADWQRGSWHALAFGARISPSFGGDGAYPKGIVAGGEAGWSASDQRALALGLFSRDDRGGTRLSPRAGSVRGAIGAGAFTLSGEWVVERGTDGPVPMRGQGGHLCAHATIPAPLKPFAEVEYFRFSGDDPATPEDEAYYPWNYRWNDWSHFYVSDLIGSTLLADSDARIWKLALGVTPRENTAVRLLLHRIDLDTGSSYGGLPVGVGRGFADEADLVVDQSVGDHWSGWVMGAYAVPRAAAKALVGGSAPSGQLFVSLSYKFSAPGGAGD